MEAGSNRRVVLVQIEELSLRITESLYLCSTFSEKGHEVK